MKHILVAFDFDHTIVDINSDVAIRKMIPDHHITEDVKEVYRTEGFTSYMQCIFNLLHDHNITREAILKECHLFQPTAGMTHLILQLKKTLNADIIIISDSNSVFIGEWLRSKGLQTYIDVIYTNPATFTEEGILKIKQYHEQDWCTLSSKNLCKGHILQEHVRGKVEGYDMIAYVGDGKNDLCPSLTLKKGDLIFARSGYQLLDSLKDCEITKNHSIHGHVHSWTSGNDILEIIKANLKQNS